MSDPVEPSESNRFARGPGAPPPLSPTARRLRFVLGVALTLLLAALLTLALILLGALIVRGVGKRDAIALGAALAVIAMTVAMARGRRKKK